MATTINYLVGLLWSGGGDARRAKSDLKDLGETGDKSAKQLQGTSSKLDGVKKQLAALGVAGLAVGAGKAFLDFSKQAVSAAADVEEGLSKASVVFGDFYQETREELQLFAEEANRSQYDLIDMASGIQALVVPMGLAREEAGELSVNMTKLAEDLASFHNSDAESAALAIKSGLAGESEPLKKYGVLLNETRVKQEAMQSGLWDGVGALTELAKVQARVNIIMRDTVDAQGDAINTADSYTNKVKGWEAAVKDLQVVYGQKVLPLLSPAVGGATDLLGGLVDSVTNDPIANAGAGGILSDDQVSVASLVQLLAGTGLGDAGDGRIKQWYQDILSYIEEQQSLIDGASSSDQLFNNYITPSTPAGGGGIPLGWSDWIAGKSSGPQPQTDGEVQAQELERFTQLWAGVSAEVKKVVEAQEALDSANVWETAQATEDLNQASQDLAESNTQWVYDLIIGAEGATEANMALAVELGLVTQAEADLQAQTATTREELEGMVETSDFLALSAERRAAAIKAVNDGMTGQEAVKRQGWGQEYDDIAGRVGDGILADKLFIDKGPPISAIDDITVELEELDSSEYDAEVSLNDDEMLEDIRLLKEELDRLTQPRTAVVRIKRETEGGNSEFAQGVDSFTVPPGYPSDSYVVGLSSGETISVSPFGKNRESGGGLNINITNHIESGSRVDVALIERVQRDATTRALREAGLL